jgi:hypothetical protein
MNTTKNSFAVPGMIFLALFIFLFAFFLYTFLHEAGHALAGSLLGQSLTEFDVSFWDLSAHVGLSGADLTQTQLAYRSAAGALLPFLIWAIFIALVPRKGSLPVETLKLTSSMVVINTLLAWIILRVLFTYGKAPSDDVTNFLIYSRMPPMLLSFTAIILYAGGWILFLSKIDGFKNEFFMFRTIEAGWLHDCRRTIPIMTGILVFCVALAYALNASAAKNPLARLSPPPDFVPVAQIDLSTHPYSSETIARFTLDQPSYGRVFIKVQDIDTQYFDLSVFGPGETRFPILHGEGYKANEDGGLWEKNLPAGSYRLVLTSAQSPGTASVYLRTINTKGN